MKVKLFYQKQKQSLEEFENQVNDFMAGVEVIDVKFSATQFSEPFNSVANVLVLYR